MVVGWLVGKTEMIVRISKMVGWLLPLVALGEITSLPVLTPNTMPHHQKRRFANKKMIVSLVGFE